ncbi:cytochrome c oxidase assembly protein [Nonomuraea fuscirosea]|uniref:cytochrome c oxidase assembly protein n=1 Tax=Nonomuraea fuscirosea TaxID=1291556 RepID=UPI0034040A4B
MAVSARLYAVLAVGSGVLVLVAALRFGGGAGVPPIAGLPAAGPLTDWGLPLARFAHELCAVACVGTALAAVLAPAVSPESARCLRAAGWWALGWAFAGLLGYVLTLSSFIPMPVADLLAAPGLLSVGTDLPQTRALLVVTAVTFVVAVATMAPRLPRWIPVAVAVCGLLPPAYVGHAASAGDHDLAVSALMAHLVPMALWVGGLGAVLVYFRRSGDLPVVLPRFSTIALCCFAAVAFSGAVSGWVRLNALSDLWRSPYGLLLLAKIAALAVLGWFGWVHRRRTVAGVADRGVRRTFVRLAAGELGVMAVAMGLGVGLARTPPPPGGEGGGHAHPLLEYTLAPFSPGALIGEWRPDVLIVLLLALPAVAYALGVRRVAAWPFSRTIAWYAGLGLAAPALLGGVAGYARAMLPAQALQHVALAVAVPLLLCLGAPLTLASRATSPASRFGALGSTESRSGALGSPESRSGGPGSPAFGRRLTGPVLLAAYPLLFLLLYGTDWLAWSLTGYAPHLVTELLFLGVGLVTSWVLTGVDPLPRPFARGERMRLLGVVAGTHVAVGAYLMLGPPVAADWLVQTAPPGAPDLLTGQRAAAAVFLIVPLLTLAPLALRLARRRPAARWPWSHVRVADVSAEVTTDVSADVSTDTGTDGSGERSADVSAGRVQGRVVRDDPVSLTDGALLLDKGPRRPPAPAHGRRPPG